TAGNIPKLVKSSLLEDACGDARAVAAAAVNRRRLIAIKLAYSLAKLRYINVMCAGNMTLFPFTGRTHIDDLQRRLSIVQLVDAHLSDPFQRKSRCMPRFHSADQIAGEFRVSGPNNQTHDSFKIVVIFEHEKNRLFRIERSEER